MNNCALTYLILLQHPYNLLLAAIDKDKSGQKFKKEMGNNVTVSTIINKFTEKIIWY